MIQTQTVDITYVQYVLDRCPNFDYIVNYNFEEGDVLTRKLIDWYKELIFSIKLYQSYKYFFQFLHLRL